MAALAAWRTRVGSWPAVALALALLAGGPASPGRAQPPPPVVPAPVAPAPDATADGASSAETLPSDADWTRDAEARGRLFDAVADRLEAVYHAPEAIDWRAWRARNRPRVVDAEGRPALDAAFRRALADLDDGHTRWIGREPAPREPAAEPSPRPADADVRLGVRAEPLEGRGLLLLRVHPGGAADGAGLRRGDVVVAAGDAALDEPGLGWAMQDRIAAELRAGAARLEVMRPGQGRVTVEVVPQALPDGATDRPVGELDPATGVARLEIPAFVPGTADAAHAEVARLSEAGARALALDLRGNPGGSVVEMGLVLGLFLEGTAVEAWARGERDWTLEVDADGVLVARLMRRSGPYEGREMVSGRLERPARWNGPVGVLVDGRTASAAEVLAGALRREVDAVLVGSDTPGNVETVQRVRFVGGNAAWVAVGDLRWPDGASVEPLAVDASARLDALELARGHDAPLAELARRLRDLPVTPGRWF